MIPGGVKNIHGVHINKKSPTKWGLLNVAKEGFEPPSASRRIRARRATAAKDAYKSTLCRLLFSTASPFSLLPI